MQDEFVVICEARALANIFPRIWTAAFLLSILFVFLSGVELIVLRLLRINVFIDLVLLVQFLTIFSIIKVVWIMLCPNLWGNNVISVRNIYVVNKR